MPVISVLSTGHDSVCPHYTRTDPDVQPRPTKDVNKTDELQTAQRPARAPTQALRRPGHRTFIQDGGAEQRMRGAG